MVPELNLIIIDFQETIRESKNLRICHIFYISLEIVHGPLVQLITVLFLPTKSSLLMR